jgi:hypothetical protein
MDNALSPLFPLQHADGRGWLLTRMIQNGI